MKPAMKSAKLLVEVKRDGVWILLHRMELTDALNFARRAKELLKDPEIEDLILSLEQPGPEGHLMRQEFFWAPKPPANDADTTGSRRKTGTVELARTALAASVVGIASLVGLHSWFIK